MSLDCSLCTEDSGFHIEGRCNTPPTLEACDALLADARLRFLTSIVAKDLKDCRRQQRRLDWLLDVRNDLRLVTA